MLLQLSMPAVAASAVADAALVGVYAPSDGSVILAAASSLVAGIAARATTVHL